MVIRIKATFFCITFLFSLLKGQENFVHFMPEEGLPSSEVFDILQDTKGFIWVATDCGVSRYNGYRFENFSLADGLPDHVVLNLFEDNEHHIWFSSLSGKLSYYDYHSAKIIKFAYNETLDKKYKSPRFFRCMTQAKKGDLIFGYIGIGKIQVETNGTLYSAPAPKDTTVAHFIVEEVNGKLFYYSNRSYPQKLPEESIVHIKCGKTDTAFRIKNNLEPLYNIAALKRKDGGLIIYVPGIVIEFDRNGRCQTDSLQDEIYRFYEDSRNRLWLCMKKGGVRKYDPGISYFTGKYSTLLEGQSVSNAFEDRDGGIWVGMLRAGLYYFPNYLLDIEKWSCISSKKIPTGLCTSKSSLYIAADNDSVFKIEKNNCSYFAKGPRGHGPGMAYYPKENGILISGNGVYLIKENSKEKKLFSVNETASASYSYDILVDSTILAGGNGFLLEVDPRLPNAEKKYFKISGTQVTKFFRSGNKMLVGTSRGLFYLQEGNLKEYPLNGTKKTKISDIKNLGEKIIVATQGNGLIISDNYKTRSITIKAGLLDNSINSIDVFGNSVWLSTNQGINEIRFDKDSFSIGAYTTGSGLPTNEIKKIVVFENSLWFACTKGLFSFSLENKKEKKVPLLGYIVSVKSGDTVFAGKNLEKNQHLMYNTNVLIDFIALDYRQRGNIQYRYRLIGSDTNWRETTGTRAEFAFLNSGDYRFEVIAKSDNGTWNTTPATFSFYVQPPFWKTWWFVFLCILFFLLVSYSIFKTRINQLKKLNKQKELILEYRHRALIAQINPHFIFNSLNSIYAFILTENKRSAAKYLTMFSKLMRLSLDNSMTDYIPLSKDLEALQLYVDLETLRFKNNFLFSIDLENSLFAESILVPAMLIQPFVENSIRHGLVHKKDAGGQLAVRISRSGNNILCEVEDNGIGREQAALLKNDTEHKSAGTHITLQRLLTGVEKLKMPYFLEYIDKKNSAGTVVRFFLPYKIKNKKDESSNY